jgi:hypothetical protein
MPDFLATEACPQLSTVTNSIIYIYWIPILQKDRAAVVKFKTSIVRGSLRRITVGRLPTQNIGRGLKPVHHFLPRLVVQLASRSQTDKNTDTVNISQKSLAIHGNPNWKSRRCGSACAVSFHEPTAIANTVCTSITQVRLLNLPISLFASK